MKKIALALLGIIGFCSIVSAQARTKEMLNQSGIYFFNKLGQFVYPKDSSDYTRVILPPDSSDMNLYIVKDFYPDGKPMRIGKSLTASCYLKRQGTFIEYFPNGHRKKIENYENNVRTGDVTSYYPNGKFYYTYNFDNNLKQYIITAASDSSGIALAENDNGTWIEYDDDFKFVKGTGPIISGLKDGEWHGVLNDSIRYVCTYNKGLSVSGTSYEKSGKEHHFTKDVVLPEFIGGMAKFYNFLGKTIHYTMSARVSDVEGIVYVTFIVEKDGRLTNIEIWRGVGYGLDEEALRVISLSPPWAPGYEYGLPVRERFTIPISFKQQNDH